MSQGPPNPGFRSVKVQTEDFLKKDSQDFKNSSYLGFQGPPNPGFRSVKVQTETFLKKDSRDFKNSFYLGFL